MITASESSLKCLLSGSDVLVCVCVCVWGGGGGGVKRRVCTDPFTDCEVIVNSKIMTECPQESFNAIILS